MSLRLFFRNILSIENISLKNGNICTEIHTFISEARTLSIDLRCNNLFSFFLLTDFYRDVRAVQDSRATQVRGIVTKRQSLCGYMLRVNARLELIKILEIGEASTWEPIPQCSVWWEEAARLELDLTKRIQKE